MRTNSRRQLPVGHEPQQVLLGLAQMTARVRNVPCAIPLEIAFEDCC